MLRKIHDNFSSGNKGDTYSEKVNISVFREYVHIYFAYQDNLSEKHCLGCLFGSTNRVSIIWSSRAVLRGTVTIFIEL